MRIGLHGYSLRGLGDMAQMVRLSHALAHHDVVWLGHRPAGGAGRLWLQTPVFLDSYRHGGFSADARQELTWRGEALVRRLAAEPLDVLIVNYFPFGRLDFLPELLPVLQACRRMGIPVVCSLRDIAGKDPWPADQQAQTVAVVNAHLDAILWHGDDSFLPMDFPQRDRLRVPILPTGYLCGEAPPPRPVAKHVVATFGSGGGGGTYAGLVMLAAYRRLAHQGWRLTLVTGYKPWERLSQAAAAADWPGLALRRWEPDLPGLLATAAVCVTQCGYGSFHQIARSGRPTLLIPWERPKDREQIMRATALCRYPGYRMESFVAADLAERVADAIPALASEEVALPVINWQGLAATCDALGRLLGRPVTTAGNGG